MISDIKDSSDPMAWIEALCAAHAALLLPDLYTLHHQILTTPLVTALGAKLGLTAFECRLLDLATKVHDIGKLGVMLDLHIHRSQTISTQSHLFARISQHTVIGERFFQVLACHVGHQNVLLPMAMVARSHHERWDGAGKPDGTAGDSTPLMARIICVLDSLEAMTGPNRPYRAPLVLADARQELHRCAGTQFDPSIVVALESLFGYVD